MRKFYFLIIVSLVLLFVSCTKAKQAEAVRNSKIESVATACLDSISKPTIENEKIWNLHDFKIFGSNIEAFSFSKFRIDKKKSSYSDDLSQLYYKTWLKGIDPSFKLVKQVIEIQVSVKKIGDTYKATDNSFQVVRKLSFFQQFAFFILSTLLTFITVLGILYGSGIMYLFFSIIPDENELGCATIILTIIFGIIAFISLNTYFGSILVSVIGTILSALLLLIVLGIINKK